MTSINLRERRRRIKARRAETNKQRAERLTLRENRYLIPCDIDGCELVGTPGAIRHHRVRWHRA